MKQISIKRKIACFTIVTFSALLFSGCDDKAESMFKDSRDGQKYKYVTIGDQTWMAENLNYNANGSKCYDDALGNCEIYGRLYNWVTAMNLNDSCNIKVCAGQVQTVHQGICPKGWHVPSDAEWTTLINYVGVSTAGMRLKSTSGWNKDRNDDGNGTDDYSFSALPGAGGNSNGSFSSGTGYDGYWLAATEDDSNYAYLRSMSCNRENVRRLSYDKTSLSSVRCVRD